MRSRTTDTELAQAMAMNPNLGLKRPARRPSTTPRVPPSRQSGLDSASTRSILASSKTSKYRNQKTEIDGIAFDSKKEAARYGELRILDQQGAIASLRRQVEYKLAVNGFHICSFVADFVYLEMGREVVEDVKSEITRKNRAYRIKVKLMRAIHGIEIRET